MKYRTFATYNPSKLKKKEDAKPKRRWGDFETKHSMQRRSPWHDYNKIGTYMLTLTVADRQPLLGTLVGTSPDDAHIELSPLGEAIRVHEIAKISHYYPMVEVWRLCIMPDHLHMIVRVKADMPEGRHLGLVVAGFKGGCSKAAMSMGLTSASVLCTSVHAPTRCERNENGDTPPLSLALSSPQATTTRSSSTKASSTTGSTTSTTILAASFLSARTHNSSPSSTTWI